MKRRMAYLILGIAFLLPAYFCLNTTLVYGSYGSLSLTPGFPFEEARANADFYTALLLIYLSVSAVCWFKFFRSVKSNK
jgi:hypothetical protein